MSESELIPVGTIALCYCRRALIVTGHDRWGKPAWTHMVELTVAHHPSPLWWDHTLDEHELRAVELRRENKRLRAELDDAITFQELRISLAAFAQWLKLDEEFGADVAELVDRFIAETVVAE